MQEAAYQVYILRNREGRYYIGLSEDVEARLVQHNTGESKWTKRERPWSLVWTSSAMSLSDARKLENKLKRQGRGQGFFTITGLKRSDS
jgi:putative endonuclease